MQATKQQEVMRLYGTLSFNKLEESTTKAFMENVKKSVERGQNLADQVANGLTAGKRMVEVVGQPTSFEDVPVDVASARDGLANLCKQVQPVVDHWRPFIESASELLGLDVKELLPVGMVPDPEGMERQLQQMTVELASVKDQLETAQLEQLELKDKLEHTGDQAAALKAAQDALDTEKKRSADLAAENEALKEQLAKPAVAPAQ
jgi:hypothetical protein